MLVQRAVVRKRDAIYSERVMIQSKARNATAMCREGSLPDSDTMYAALVDRDSRFDGLFVAAVKTTGVFCRPTCRARKPNRENVEFFATPREAVLHGYRPVSYTHLRAHET